MPTKPCPSLVALAILILTIGVVSAAAESSSRFVRQPAGDELCLVCHGGFNILGGATQHTGRSLWVDAALYAESVHEPLGCVACHTNVTGAGHGATEQAACGLEHKSAGGVLALAACAQCHTEEYEQYEYSAHGSAVLREEETAAAYCDDCHGAHYILPTSDERAWTNAANVPATCLKCHAVEGIPGRFELSRDVPGTFEQSFHSMRGELGSRAVAVCSSCHGHHDVYGKESSRSRINPRRIGETCGECHRGAQLNFAASFTHNKLGRNWQVGLYVIVQTHKWLIVLIIGPLFLIALTDAYRRIRRRREDRHA